MNGKITKTLENWVADFEQEAFDASVDLLDAIGAGEEEFSSLLLSRLESREVSSRLTMREIPGLGDWSRMSRIVQGLLKDPALLAGACIEQDKVTIPVEIWGQAVTGGTLHDLMSRGVTLNLVQRFNVGGTTLLLDFGPALENLSRAKVKGVSAEE